MPDKTKISAAILLLGCSTLANASQPAGTACEYDADKLGARYIVTEFATGDDPATGEVVHIQLWRHGNQVAYVHEEKQITEIWDLVSNGRQKLIRYFDEHERAIEYQPEDFESGRGADAWNARYQIVTDADRASMKMTKSEGRGCDAVAVYESQSANRQMVVHWRPELQLLQELSRKSGGQTFSWKLDSLVTDADRVDMEFTKRHRYNTVDFVDIGDNESDPFLQKLINLGFIEHNHEH